MLIYMATAEEILQRRDDEYRIEVRNSLKSLAEGQISMGHRQDELAEHFAQMKSDNVEQHSELATEIRVLAAKYEAAMNASVKSLTEADKKLTSRNKVIAVAFSVVLFLFGVILGTQEKMIGLLRDMVKAF